MKEIGLGILLTGLTGMLITVGKITYEEAGFEGLAIYASAISAIAGMTILIISANIH